MSFRVVLVALLMCGAPGPTWAEPSCPLYDADAKNAARPAAVGSVALTTPPLRVHYCHAELRPMAERVLAAAARSYHVEVGELGFAAPLADAGRGGGPELDLYLANQGRGGRAQANEEPVKDDDRRTPGYVVIDYHTPEANDFLASYVAHEMHHVLQYGSGGRLVGAPFQEAVAAYIDDRLYPQADILPAMVADFQREPHRPIYHHDPNTGYDYGAALFVDYLVQRYGLGLVRRVYARGAPDYLASLDGELRARGGELAAALREFSRWRVRTGRYHRSGFFTGGQRFPEVALDQAVSPFAFLDEPLVVRLLRPPQELGAAYLGLDLTTPLGGGMTIEVQADEGPGLLAVDLLGSDGPAPLDGALVRGGGQVVLRANKLRPGMRLWLAVTNLGQGPPRLRTGDLSTTSHNLTARFLRLPEKM